MIAAAGAEGAGAAIEISARTVGAEIEISALRFAHPGQRVPLAIESLAIAAGERVAVIGPSGSGKTTLLHLIAGILVPEQGAVRVGGRDLAREPERARRRFRIREIGLVFQEFELLEHLSVEENIELPFAIEPRLLAGERAGRAARVGPLAERLGIAALLARPPRRLSHGERQRVAIARALVVGPRLLLADEPTGNLDPATGAEVLDSLFAEASRLGTTVVMVTHDHALLGRFGRVIDLAALVAAAGISGTAEEAA